MESSNPKSANAGSANLFIISAPSGAGKTTLCKALLNRFPDIRYSVSSTTRPPRDGEAHGRDYFFVDKETFEEKLAKGLWAEWAEVHGNYYGTSDEFLSRCLENGNDVLLDIDVQGARQILTRYPDSVTIFVMPPSMETLRIRLESRAADSKEVIERRLRDAEGEIAQRDMYAHVIVNDRLDEASARLIELVSEYRGRRR